MTDLINHPSHYIQGDIECIDAIRAMCGDDERFEAYLRGNVCKYLWRYDKKAGSEDLKKASWYLDMLTKEVCTDEVLQASESMQQPCNDTEKTPKPKYGIKADKPTETTKDELLKTVKKQCIANREYVVDSFKKIVPVDEITDENTLCGPWVAF